MDVVSTPKRTIPIRFALPASRTEDRQMESRVLEQVSRLTLQELRTPPQVFHTPIVRKRKPSFVTPPRITEKENYADPSPVSSNQTSRKRLKGLPPMLPNNLEMDECISGNPFTRHRPMHSPTSGVSKINFDFISRLREEDKDQKNASENKRARILPRTVGTHFPSDIFPDLENHRPFTGGLKMRRMRQNNDEDDSPIPLLDFHF